jgi:hypothetical protein
MLGGNLVMGLALASVAINAQLPVLLVASVIAGTTQSLVRVTYLTLRTAESPDALLGRIGSTARTISLGLQPIGLLVGGALVDATSASLTITVMAIGVAGVSLVFLPAASFRRARLATR